MKHLVKILVTAIIFNLALLPVVQANPTPSTPERSDHLQEVQSQIQKLTSEKFKTSFAQKSKEEGILLLNESGKETSLSDLATQGTSHFAVVTDGGASGDRIAVEFKTEILSDGAVKTRLFAHNYSANPELNAAKALDQTSITLSAKDDAAAAQLKINRAFERLAASVDMKMAATTAKAAKSSLVAKAYGLLFPSAHAGGSIAQKIKTVCVYGMVGSVVVLLGLYAHLYFFEPNTEPVNHAGIAFMTLVALSGFALTWSINAIIDAARD